jgi:DNA-binding MarR family transcriptional regulator
MARRRTGEPSLEDVQRAASFRVALRAFQRGTERVARSAGLTPQWYLLLLLVKGSEQGSERASVGELARRMHLAQSSVSELVNRAERAGLVRRTASNLDGRVAHIALTAKGEERFAASFRALAEERRALRSAVVELDA